MIFFPVFVNALLIFLILLIPFDTHVAAFETIVVELTRMLKTPAVNVLLNDVYKPTRKCNMFSRPSMPDILWLLYDY